MDRNTAGTDRVVAVDHCRLVRRAEPWAFPGQHGPAIDAHWQRRTEESPSFYNGTVHLLSRYDVSDGVLNGTIFPVEFKNFLFWRESGTTDAAVRDAFGSALIRTADGDIILGRQRPGNVNSGLAYVPGGFIDARDIGVDGAVDIEASILREVEEETGFGADHWHHAPGFRVTFQGQHISIARELCSPLATDAFLAEVRSRLAADPSSELEDVVAIRSVNDMDRYNLPPFVHLLLRDVLGVHG
ncbi:MAG: NUDIX hydrolase [Hyphomicrobium sp.]|nr:NUDIX hydrolase [Hyphomicrobium sp.]